MVSTVHLVALEQQVLQVTLDSKDLLVHRVHVDLQEVQDLLEPVDKLDHLVLRVSVAQSA